MGVVCVSSSSTYWRISPWGCVYAAESTTGSRTGQASFILDLFRSPSGNSRSWRGVSSPCPDGRERQIQKPARKQVRGQRRANRQRRRMGRTVDGKGFRLQIPLGLDLDGDDAVHALDQDSQVFPTWRAPLRTSGLRNRLFFHSSSFSSANRFITDSGGRNADDNIIRLGENQDENDGQFGETGDESTHTPSTPSRLPRGRSRARRRRNGASVRSSRSWWGV